MKKKISFISSIIFMIAITGCSSKQKNALQQHSEKKLVGIANPIHESSTETVFPPKTSFYENMQFYENKLRKCLLNTAL